MVTSWAARGAVEPRRVGPALSAGLALGLLLGSCGTWQGGGDAPTVEPLPAWVLAPPADEGPVWVAVGVGVGVDLQEATERATRDGRRRLVEAARGPLAGTPEAVTALAGARADSERRFVQRLDGGLLRVSVQVRAPELSLRPLAWLDERLAAASAGQRAGTLLEVARGLVTLGLDDPARTVLGRLGDERDTAPADLLDAADLHLALGDRERALAVHEQARSALSPRAVDDPVRRAAERQAALLASGLVPVSASLMALERLTLDSVDATVLAVPAGELVCQGTDVTRLDIELPGEQGVLVPLLIDTQRVAVERMSEGGRIRGRRVTLMLGLPETCQGGTLLLWVVPEGAGVLAAVEALRRNPVPRDMGLAGDDDRRRMKELVDGFAALADREPVGAARVQLVR